MPVMARSNIALSTALRISLALGVATTTALAAAPTGPRSDGATLLFALASPESAQNPAYAPDGARIVLTLFHRGYNDGPAGLHVLPIGQSVTSRLLDEADHDSVNLPGSCWNQASALVVFSSDRAERHEIWTVGDSGSPLSRVTTGVDRGESIEPSFSPDGAWIVFEARKGSSGGGTGSLWKIRVDGTELTRLTDGSGQGFDDRQPNWSPRGDRIVFQRRPAGADLWGLYTISPDGGDPIPLLVSNFDHSDASFSPDGRWVVFSSEEEGVAKPQIFVISLAGGTPVRVTADPRFFDTAPSWSPDGRSIAFESHADDTSAASVWQIAAPTLWTPRKRPVRRR